MPSRLTAVKLWNSQFPEFKILGVPVSRCMRALASRDKVDVDIGCVPQRHSVCTGKTKKVEIQQYQILKEKDAWAMGKRLLIIPELRVMVLTKRQVGSGNEIGLTTAGTAGAAAVYERLEIMDITQCMSRSPDQVIRLYFIHATDKKG